MVSPVLMVFLQDSPDTGMDVLSWAFLPASLVALVLVFGFGTGSTWLILGGAAFGMISMLVRQ